MATNNTSLDDAVITFGDEDESNKRRFKHPIAVVCHVGFRSAALLAYLFSSWFSNSFIISFLIILFLLSLDFWTVKNITGRLLVGLRWWNSVDVEGKSHWKFESRKDQSKVNAAESRIFWAALVFAPCLWVIFVIVSFLSLQWRWLMVVLLGCAMSGANLYGYMRCKWNTKQEMSSYLSQTMFKSLFTRATAQAATNAVRLT